MSYLTGGSLLGALGARQPNNAVCDGNFGSHKISSDCWGNRKQKTLAWHLGRTDAKRSAMLAEWVMSPNKNSGCQRLEWASLVGHLRASCHRLMLGVGHVLTSWREDNMASFGISHGLCLLNFACSFPSASFPCNNPEEFSVSSVKPSSKFWNWVWSGDLPLNLQLLLKWGHSCEDCAQMPLNTIFLL